MASHFSHRQIDPLSSNYAQHWWVFRAKAGVGLDHLSDESWHGYGTRIEAWDYLAHEFDKRYSCEIETFAGMSDEEIDDIRECGLRFEDELPEDNTDLDLQREYGTLNHAQQGIMRGGRLMSYDPMSAHTADDVPDGDDE